MRAIETEGKTEEEAVEAALTELGLQHDQVQVEVLAQEHRGGILGFLGQPVVRVRVTPLEGADKAGTAEETPPEVQEVAETAPEEPDQTPAEEEIPVEEPAPEETAPAPTEPESVAAGEERAETEPEAAEAVEEGGAPEEEFDWSEEALLLVQDFIDAMDLDLTAEITRAEEGDINIEVEGPDLGIFIGRQGGTINAFQYLINVILNRQSSTRLRVVIDGEGYRARRERALKKMARGAADRVQRSGMEVRLEPLRSFERRIVHLALQEDPGVFTYSEGEEPYRRVVVAPTQQNDELVDESRPVEPPPVRDRNRQLKPSRRDRSATPAEEDDFERRWLEEDKVEEGEGIDYVEDEEEMLAAETEPQAAESETSDEQADSEEPVIS